MAARTPAVVLLCATRFWAGGAGAFSKTTPTLRQGVRHVARKQGVTAKELDKAERKLVARGLVVRPPSTAATIALTDRGLKVATRVCRRVPLPPWDPQKYY